MSGERWGETVQTEKRGTREASFQKLPALHGDAWCGRQTTLSLLEISQRKRAGHSQVGVTDSH